MQSGHLAVQRVLAMSFPAGCCWVVSYACVKRSWGSCLYVTFYFGAPFFSLQKERSRSIVHIIQSDTIAIHVQILWSKLYFSAVIIKPNVPLHTWNCWLFSCSVNCHTLGIFFHMRGFSYFLSITYKQAQTFYLVYLPKYNMTLLWNCTKQFVSHHYLCHSELSPCTILKCQSYIKPQWEEKEQKEPPKNGRKSTALPVGKGFHCSRIEKQKKGAGFIFSAQLIHLEQTRLKNRCRPCWSRLTALSCWDIFSLNQKHLHTQAVCMMLCTRKGIIHEGWKSYANEEEAVWPILCKDHTASLDPLEPHWCLTTRPSDVVEPKLSFCHHSLLACVEKSAA